MFVGILTRILEVDGKRTQCHPSKHPPFENRKGWGQPHFGGTNIERVGQPPSANNSVLNVNVTRNNLESLQLALKQRGVSSEDLQQLQTAIAEDPQPTEGNKFGPRVSRWMGSMATKAAEGVWKMSLDVGTKVIAEALTKYYGLS